MRIYVQRWEDDVAKLTIFEHWGDDFAKLIIFRYWGDEIDSYGKIFTFMKYTGGMLPDYWGGYIPPISPKFEPMLIEFSKNICKSRDKSYPTDQKISSILVPAAFGVWGRVSRFFGGL